VQDEILSLPDSKALSLVSAFARAKMRGAEQQVRGDSSLAKAMEKELLPGVLDDGSERPRLRSS